MPRQSPFTITRDPMNGIGLEERARARRFQQAVDGIENYDQGTIMANGSAPLPDPKWDGFFQAVSEATGGQDMQYGYAQQPDEDLSRNTKHASEALDSVPIPWDLNLRSQQLGTPLDRIERVRRSLKGRE